MIDVQLHAPGNPPRKLAFGRAIDVLDGGNHHPILCELEADGGPAGTWVVKPQDVVSIGNRREGALNVVAELASAEVCAWAGVPVPATGLVRFPPKPVDHFTGSLPEKWQKEIRTVFEINQNRLAFCCKFLQEAVDIDPDTLKGAKGKAATVRYGGILFAVDAYLRHDDRRKDNPNAGWLPGDDIVALDHGSAFSGIDRPGTNGKDVAAYTVLQSPGAFREHIFYEPLQRNGRGVDWQGVADRLAQVSDDQINQAANGWPDELRPWKAKVVEFLSARRKFAADVISNAAKLISATSAVRKDNGEG